LSLKEHLGIEGSFLPSLATGFGGGVGRKGSLCGAFTGSIMAIGMKMGRTDPNDKETLQKVYEKCQQFWDKFEEEFGSRECYPLTKHRLEDPEEYKKWVSSGGRERCTQIVAKAAQMLFKLIERS
jgi:C_GCAxxG_C_C family probable redox protein